VRVWVWGNLAPEKPGSHLIVPRATTTVQVAASAGARRRGVADSSLFHRFASPPSSCRFSPSDLPGKSCEKVDENEGGDRTRKSR
jgi:hypothetical protein